MGPSVYQCDCRTCRRWKIHLWQEIRTQFPTYDDSQARSDLVVLWRIPDFIRNRRWSGLSTRIAGLGHPRLDPRDKHFIILDDLMDETDQRVASLFTKKSHHRNISVMYIVQNLFHRGKHHRTISLNAHYMVQKPKRRIPDHGTSTPNVSQENAIFPGSLCPSYSQTSRLHGDRYETKHAGYPEIENLHLSR